MKYADVYPEEILQPTRSQINLEDTMSEIDISRNVLAKAGSSA